jgi:DNA-binding MarR family transcriptional regulator
MRRIVHALRSSPDVRVGAVTLSDAQASTLRLIASRPGTSVRDVAALTFKQPTSASHIVTQLATKGLVCKSRSKRGRRRIALTVTGAGRNLLALTPQPKVNRLAAALRALSPEDVRRVKSALAKIQRFVARR